MKKSVLFGIVCGLLAPISAYALGFSIKDVQFWLITLAILIILSVIYDFCED